MKDLLDDEQLYQDLRKASGYSFHGDGQEEIAFSFTHRFMEERNIPMNEVFRSPLDERIFVYYDNKESNLFTIYLSDRSVYAKNCTENETREIIAELLVKYPDAIPTPAGQVPSTMLVDIFSKTSRISNFIGAWNAGEITTDNLRYHEYALSLLNRIEFRRKLEEFDTGRLEEKDFINYAEALIRSIPEVWNAHNRRTREVVRVDMITRSYTLDYSPEENKAIATIPLYETVSSNSEGKTPLRILRGEGETFNEAMINLARVVDESYDPYWDAIVE